MVVPEQENERDGDERQTAGAPPGTRPAARAPLVVLLLVAGRRHMDGPGRADLGVVVGAVRHAARRRVRAVQS